MSLISPLSIVDASAKLGENIKVGPWTTIGPNVEIGDDTVIESHVVIKGPTVIGRSNKIHQFSVIGEDTPDLKYNNEPTKLVIGNNNTIREGVTIHRGTIQDKGITIIGNDNLIMAYVHVGHDSIISNNCILVNNTALAGHVIIDDYAILSGYTLVHQYCTIGKHSFSAMGTAIGKDVPSYVTVSGNPAIARGLNFVGLKRRNFSNEVIQALRSAYKIVYRSNLTTPEALKKLDVLANKFIEVSEFSKSIYNSKRGITR